ncbi:MAG: tetratricopeptide repeat protein, partial [Pseudomonadales bacterium]
QALALYFNNKGAEHIIAGDHGTAIENLRHALTLNPRFGDAWNNLGAALRREGQLKLAEYAYQYAIEIDANNFSAMNNLAQFYVSQGREVEAIDIGKRVARYRQRNPYFLYFIAQRFYEQGRWDEAITLLERSIALKRDEPDFYEAIATSYDQLGNEQQRDEYLALARQYREAIGIRNVPRERGHRFWIQTLNIN